jgi:hypothetical protein
MSQSDDFQRLYERAQQAARDHDAERARVLLRAAVALASEPPQEKRALLALAHLETSPQAKAAAYRRILELDPRDAVARAYLQGMRDARSAPATPEREPARRRSALWLALPVLLLALLGFGLLSLLSGAPTPSLPTSAPSLTPSQIAEQANLAPPQAQAQMLPQASPTRPSQAANVLAAQTQEASPSPPAMSSPTPQPSATLASFVLPTETPTGGSGPAPLILPTTAPLILPTTAPLILPTALASATPTTTNPVLPSATPTLNDFVPLPTSTTIPPLILPTAVLPPTEAPPIPGPPPPDFPLDPFSGGGSSRP